MPIPLYREKTPGMRAKPAVLDGKNKKYRIGWSIKWGASAELLTQRIQKNHSEKITAKKSQRVSFNRNPPQQSYTQTAGFLEPLLGFGAKIDAFSRNVRTRSVG